MEKSTQIQIENLGAALVREYLYRKGLRETLICMDREYPRAAESINSRMSLARELNMEQLIRRNRAQEKPFRTMIELIVHHIQEGSSLWPKGKKATHTKNTMGEEQKDKATFFRFTDVNVSLENIFDLKYLETSSPKEMIPKPLEFKETNTTCPTKGRSSRDRGSREEETTPQEPHLPEHNQCYQQQLTREHEDLQNVLRAKEKVLLSSLSESHVDYDNKHRLGSNKLKARLTALHDDVTQGNTTRAPFNRSECLEETSKLPSQENKTLSNDYDTTLTELKNKLKNLESSIQIESVDNNNDTTYRSDAPTNDWFFEPRVVVHVVEDDRRPKRELEDNQSKPEGDSEGQTTQVECCISKWGCGQGSAHESEREGSEQDGVVEPDGESPDDAASVEVTGDGHATRDVTGLGGGFAPVGAKEGRVEPISEGVATALKQVVLGSGTTSFSQQWLYQGFTFNTNRKLKYGFVQTKGGCCGVLAPVQATLLKTLLYEADACSCTDPLRPTSNEARTALVRAVTEILWRAGDGETATLVVSSGGAVVSSPLTETLNLMTFTSQASLHAGVGANLHQLTTPGAAGCLLMVFSAVLSRGLDNVVSDMDEPTSLIGSGGQCPLQLVNLMTSLCYSVVSDMDEPTPLIGSGGQCPLQLVNLMTSLCYSVVSDMDELTPLIGSGGQCPLQLVNLMTSLCYSVVSDMDEPTPLIGSGGQCPLELVNLLLTGCAVSNVHDNSVQVDSCVLRGVNARADVGFLSLFEHYNSCQVGSYLKTPRFPIWVVCSDEHFTVLFSCRRELVSDWRAEKRFNLFYYDTMAKQTDEIKLTIDTTGLHAKAKESKRMVPPLEHCIRTKWKGATVEWSGSKPLF